MQAYGYIGQAAFHHEHPHVEGVAHCAPSRPLDMSTLTEVQPTDGSYCQKCKAREWNWIREPR